jgi:hypothetical protein
MPVQPVDNNISIELNGKVVPGTVENICPGWEDLVTCVGHFPTGEDDCRPCEIDKEVWVSLEYGANWGACFCLPKPIETIETHKEGIATGAIFLAFLAWVTGRKLFGRKGKK